MLMWPRKVIQERVCVHTHTLKHTHMHLIRDYWLCAGLVEEEEKEGLEEGGRTGGERGGGEKEH